MEKYLYFAGINGGGGGADASQDAGCFPVSRFCGVVPLNTTTTAINFTSAKADVAPHAGGAGDQIVVTHNNTTATTGHRCKIIARAMARAMNAHPNVDGMIDVCDVDNDIYYDGFHDIKDDTGFDIVITLDT